MNAAHGRFEVKESIGQIYPYLISQRSTPTLGKI